MDIYFDDNYGKLYEKIEKGKAIIYHLKNEYGEIKHQFIKREIPQLVEGKQYFDLITPYGYGGPLIINCVNEDKLLNSFEEEFGKYCLENNIVSEFVRFHPLFNNGETFKKMYNSEYVRNTLGTNLTFDDPVMEEFSKSCRKNIRSGLNKGISYKVTFQPNDISVFKNIYYQTMDRNNASDFYYFDDEYFNDCEKYFHDNLLLVEAIYEDKTIAAGLYFTSDDVIHIHLSGTLSEYLDLSPAYILRYAITLWGKEKKKNVIHNGGGRSNDENDNLYLFKKQFCRKTQFKFYIGKKIWNKNIYEELSKGRKDEVFFPLYRR